MSRIQGKTGDYKPRKAPGAFFKPRRKSGCYWCQAGERPGVTGLCDSCVAEHKSLLTSRKWAKYRRAFLSTNAFCVMCVARGDTLAEAEVVDHIQPWRFFPDLFWEESNHQGLCWPHHNHKINTEEGGFGRPRKIPGDVSPGK